MGQIFLHLRIPGKFVIKERWAISCNMWEQAYRGRFRRKGQCFGKWYIGHDEKNKILVNKCVILNGYRDRAVWISRPNSAGFLFVALDEERSLQNKFGYKRQTALSHFACCCLHKETWRLTQINNKISWHTSCKMHLYWLRIF